MRTLERIEQKLNEGKLTERQADKLAERHFRKVFAIMALFVIIMWVGTIISFAGQNDDLGQISQREGTSNNIVTLTRYKFDEKIVKTVKYEPVQVVAEEFVITHYCPCELCCGEWSDGLTYLGTEATQGRTIAVDTSVIPLGSKVYIDGLGEFIAEDVGGAIKGNRIDIYMDDHQEALEAGKIVRKVWVLE